jgi:hypothetical protein
VDFIRRILIFACLLISPVFAETAKIVEIIDTNLFRTETNELVSLANLKTISIHDPDSSNIQLAKMTMKYLSQHLLYKIVKIECVEKDTISLVDIQIVRNVLQDVSLSFEMLRFGYGRLVEEPQRKRVKSYKNAESYARIHHLGAYKIRGHEPRLPAAKNAVWLQGSLGSGFFIVFSRFAEPIYSGDLSLHARWNKSLFTVGVTDEVLQPSFALWGPYLAAGRAFSHSKMENGLYGGVRVFRFGDRPGEKINIFPIARIQAAKHGKNFGGGVSVEYSTNFEISFIKLSANLLVGKWE